jgi:hypothetical protein
MATLAPLQRRQHRLGRPVLMTLQNGLSILRSQLQTEDETRLAAALDEARKALRGRC